MFAVYNDSGKIKQLKMQISPGTPNTVRIQKDILPEVLARPSMFRVVGGVITRMGEAPVESISDDLLDIDGMQFVPNNKTHLKLLTALQVDGVKFYPINMQEAVSLTKEQIKKLLLAMV